jgi:ribonucleotide monophosphatase NagD (HAD superfamily)
MALNTPQLQAAIDAILDDMATRTNDPAQARRDFAQQLAETISAHIKTGTVTTTGTATAQTGTIS